MADVGLEGEPIGGIRAAFAAASASILLLSPWALAACEYKAADNIAAAQNAEPAASAPADSSAIADRTSHGEAIEAIPTRVTPRIVFTLNQAELSCGMTRPKDKSEAIVYLEVGASLQAQKRAVECLRAARSQYFAGEAVRLALRLVDQDSCTAIGLIYSAMEADLPNGRLGRSEAEAWAAENAARFAGVPPARLETLAGRAPGCFPVASERAEGARAALEETGRRLRSGQLTDAKIGSEQ